jgi:haloalkane dehalogenase
MSIIRSAPDQFSDVAFAQRFVATPLRWDAPDIGTLDLAVIDEGSAERGTFLLLHGEPSWSRLYADWIPTLVDAGFRCVALDQPGFGRSDKPIDDAWYTYERHCAAIRFVIESLELTGIHLVVQDWAGPNGLRQLVDMPERFARAFIFNTWLHHDGFEYNEFIRWWHAAATNPEQLGGDMPTGTIVARSSRREGHDLDALQRDFDAPFTDEASKAGARAFPAMLPFGPSAVGGAAEQQQSFDALRTWTGCPVHVIFGDADGIFTPEWGEQWALMIPGATFDRIAGAGHFVQVDAPADCVAAVLRHCG